MDLLKTVSSRNAEKKLIQYFRELTGKKYILMTASCRSALYLAYQAIDRKGIVHTSPLTCQVALQPIIAARNRICFNDIRAGDWTIDPHKIVPTITRDSTAIQAIHLGGFPCDMRKLREIADDHNLVLIEDCAQGFGSELSGVPTGKIGDIACFTLSKNVYGLGGGVLATDRKEWYERASASQANFDKESLFKVAGRTTLMLVNSLRGNDEIDKLYKQLIRTKSKLNKNDLYKQDSLLKELKLAPKLYVNSVSCRLSKIERLNSRRRRLANSLTRILVPAGFQPQINSDAKPAYTKLFFYHPGINSKMHIARLNALGIEAMHLEHKSNVFYQTKQTEALEDSSYHQSLDVYNQIHDRIISVPLFETLSKSQLDKITSSLKEMI